MNNDNNKLAIQFHGFWESSDRVFDINIILPIYSGFKTKSVVYIPLVDFH